MAKLHFKYGALNSSKTANLLMTAHNYEECGRIVWLFQSEENTRDNKRKITSRAGIAGKECFTYSKTTDLVRLINNISELIDEFPDVILIDEVQFATREQIKQLVTLVDCYEITVITYGLKVTYTGELFEAVQELLVVADKIEEIKQICRMCERKAFMNLKILNGKPSYTGEIISIGDVKTDSDEFYLPVCRKHYYKPDLSKIK